LNLDVYARIIIKYSEKETISYIANIFPHSDEKRGKNIMEENNLQYKYQVEYEETKKTLTSVCELFELDNSDLTLKFAAAVLGPVVLAFMIVYGNPGGGTPSGMAVFLMKYLAAFAAVFAALMVINRTLWGKAVRASAAGNAEQQFEKRQAVYGGAVTSRMDFYMDHFESITPSKTKSYSYERVVKFIETDSAFGLVLSSEQYRLGGPKNLFGFPKEALVDGDMEEFKRFLLNKCTNVKRGIKKF